MKRSINYYTSLWNNCVLIIFMLVISLNASAQWTRTNGPYGGPLNCIIKNNNIFYSGTIAGVFQSSNDGINRTPLKQIPPSPLRRMAPIYWPDVMMEFISQRMPAVPGLIQVPDCRTQQC